MRQVSLLIAEVINLEKRRRSFARRRRENRRVAQSEAIIVEKVSHSFNYSRAHFQDRVLLFRAQPQMTIVEEKLGPMLLRRNRKIVSVLQNFGIGDVNFDSARRARVFTHFTRYD